VADADNHTLKSAARKAGIFSFVFVMFSYTTGGPFGLEEQVTTSGPGLTLLYHLLIPFFWCVPISLVAAELSTAMPVQGGFYRWVRAGFGDFWGFLSGWWNWTSSFLLGSAYAVLFADYVRAFFPSITRWEHYWICLTLIAVVSYINIRGIQLVGRVSAVLELAVLVPVLVMTVLALAHAHHNPFVPLTPPHQPFTQVFGVGLALGVWLYSGYEQLSTVAEEVSDPRRNYPLALAIVVPMSIATYFLPTSTSLAALNNWQDWGPGYFSEAARLIGGPSLALAMTLAAAVANICLLNSTVLATTRMPFALAEDGFFPRQLTRLHPRFGTPSLSILISAMLYALLAIHSLAELITIYAWLRVATTLMTALSGWRLRKTQPQLERPFRIPLGRAGLLYSVAAPILLGILATLGSILSEASSKHKFALVWGPVAIVLGPVAYLLLGARRKVPRAASAS